MMMTNKEMMSPVELMERRLSVQMKLPYDEVKEDMEGGILWMPIAMALGAASLGGISNIFKSAGSWIGRKIFGKGQIMRNGRRLQGMGVVLPGESRMPITLPPGAKFGRGLDFSLPMTFDPHNSYPFMRGGQKEILDKIPTLINLLNENKEEITSFVKDNVENFKNPKDMAIKIGKKLKEITGENI